MSKQISITEETANDIINMLENRFENIGNYCDYVCNPNIKTKNDVKKKYIEEFGFTPTEEKLEMAIDYWNEFRRAYKLSQKICKAFEWQNPFEGYGR